MPSSICDLVDGYLEDMLGEEERQAFVDHLEHCEDCQQTLAAYRRFDELLHAATHAQEAPAALIQGIEARLRRASRRRLASWVGGLAAAIVLGLAGFAWLSHQKRVVRLPDEIAARQESTVPLKQEAVPPSPARVQLLGPPQSVAEPVKTRNPEVTIVWLYPIRRADKP